MVKLTYGKEIIATIISDHAKGATAEEIQRHLMEIYSVRPCTNTIYDHCKAITVEQVVDELQRQQERDITKETDSDVRMYYRDKLLEKLMPLKQIIISKNISQSESVVKHVIELVDPDNPAPTYPQTEVQAARRANIIPPV